MNIIKKIQHFIKSSSNVSMILMILFIISGYVFFFSSKALFGQSDKKLKFTNMNTVITIDKHDITLGKWVYCASTKTMEIELDIVNKNYDGNDTYSFDVVDKSGKKYETQAVIAAPTMDVVQIYNVPEQFYEMRIAVNVEYGNSVSQDTAKFYTNERDVEQVPEIVTYNTLNDYYVAKLNRYIENYNNEIADINKKVDEETVNLNNCKELLQSLTTQKSYTAGDELANINKQLDDTNKQIGTITAAINGYKKDISDIQKKIDDYKAIREAYTGNNN